MFCSFLSHFIISDLTSMPPRLLFRDEGEGRREPFFGVRGAAAAAANARGDWQRRRAPRLGGARRTIDNLNEINSSTTFAARVCDTSGTKLLSGAAQQDGSQVTPESQSGSQVLALHNASCGASALWILKGFLIARWLCTVQAQLCHACRAVLPAELGISRRGLVYRRKRTSNSHRFIYFSSKAGPAHPAHAERHL